MPDAVAQAIEPAAIDPAAWGGFLARLKGYVGARVEPGARDDVVGDNLLRLVQHQNGLVAARNPMAWVTRVAANAVIDYRRRRASEFRAVTAYAMDTEAVAGGSAADGAPSGEIATCLTPLIESLPARYRDALKLVEIDGLSQAEAAKRLGLSLSGAKSRVQRGRVKLKQALLRCCAIQVDRRGGILGMQSRSTGCSVGCGATAEGMQTLTTARPTITLKGETNQE